MSRPAFYESRPRATRPAMILALFVVATVGMMIVPLPTALLDVLITVNLAVAVMLLAAAVYATQALELSTFPTVLVLTTLFRLALNVSSVRLILLQADAGRVIHAFGAFVVRGDYVAGFALFLILAIVQYVVIARGAERVAEVAARFSLDALPGQQLAIDAELRAGALSTDGARGERARLSREAQFYGALDGAMRFVKGDAVAGLLILGISLVGGLVIGVVERGLPALEAARLYTLLTIGDGLVTQLPALLISTAAGLVVTRVASDQAGEGLGRDLGRQLARPRTLGIAALLLAALALVPGLPLVPFAGVAAVAAALAFSIGRRGGAREAERAPLVLALAPQLALRLKREDAQLAPRLEELSRAVSLEIGVPLPPLAVLRDSALSPGAFEVRLRGVPLACGHVPEGRLLAEGGPAALSPEVEAQTTEHPSTGALASWVPSAEAAALRKKGLLLLDGASSVSAFFEAALREAAPELVGVDETQRLLDETQRAYPALVREVIPRRIDVVRLAEVLRRLLGEGIPIGDLRDVLEAIARAPEHERDPALVTEHVRAGMKRQITHRHARDRRLHALMLDGDAEEAVLGALRPSEAGLRLALEPDLAEALLGALRRELEGAGKSAAVLLTSSELRRHVRRLIAREHPRLPVLAYQELLADVEVARVGTVGLL